ncbi:hypothetical protein Rmet_6485 [Cupriavidus metallidurans CH34]|uniref:Uncharacterized protein n=1 Tax=Cupriavidus metallidurans (strain ATCC 43123 / DSM 2839 / NBRC 102507 / CH34) TaxID=266264 RepID=D3DXS3_CUPMC|nr:hypothetical protein Rmet_6485 [Cupriavidus metallidurans CH34]
MFAYFIVFFALWGVVRLADRWGM